MEKYTGLEIAVIGLAGKFPEAENIDQYWANLKSGKDCISQFGIDDVLAEGESESIALDPHYVRAHAYVKDKEYFDAAFFDYRPDEAELMDPQIRVFHECCWEALEDSGYSSIDHKYKIGLFAAGAPNVNWVLYSSYKNREGLVDDFAANYLREISFLSSSISYKLNLKGPSIFLQTACSSSLVAILEACNSLLWGECSMALAGGVTIKNYSKRGYLYKEGMILSRDGRCRPFDIDSDGTVGGEGAGVVVLKRLKDAITDRDHIYAVIKGVGINNDGNDKVGYTAPSVKGQVEAIRKAHKMAGVAPSSISYVETHGTGTSLGDPIEIEALNEAFGSSGGNKYCAIGSVKSNTGHLDTAAGVAGFIKTVLALKNKQIPASLHFKEANPKINFEDGPFYVNATLKDWKSSAGPLRAGVSSFGIGGTNAHVVLEESPVMEYSTESRDYQLIVLSAKTKSSLARNTEQFISYLKNSDSTELSDISYTMQQGRIRFPYRKMLVCKTKAEAIDMLSYNQVKEHQSTDLQEDLQNIVFMFSGQGFQYVNMCRGLYESEQVFRAKVDACLELVKLYSKEDFRSILFSHADDSSINETRYAQPLLFIIEYSLAHLLMHWGIKPHYMIGHSIGEYVAACISGVFTLDSCLRVVVRRGELMSQVEKGSMLSIHVSEASVRPLLAQYRDINLAVVNSGTSLVVSGADVAIERFKKRVKEEGYPCKKLPTSHAFHSYMMEGILEEFEQELSAVKICEPQIPYISNLTGELVTYEEIKKPSYWSAHLRHTVQFFQGVERLLSQGKGIFIEVGPGRGLCSYVSESKLFGSGHHVFNTVRQWQQQVNDASYLTERLGYFWLKGIKIDWDRYYQGQKRRRVSLPTYSFEKTFYTTHVDARKLLARDIKGGLSAIARDHEAGLYACNWQHTVLPNEARELLEGQLTFLVISGESAFSEFLIRHLLLRGQHVIEIKAGKSFKELKKDVFEVDLSAPQAFGQYLAGLGIPINNVIYCASLRAELGSIRYEALEEKLQAGYLGLSYLTKCIAGLKQAEKINLTVVDNYLASVLGGDEVDPIKATIHGPARIIPSELLNVSSKVIDLPYPFQDDTELSDYVSKVINEIFYESNDAFVAYRYKERWVRTFGALSSNKKLKSGIEIVQKGTYIITGGFGGMGFSIARDLAHRQVRRVILVSRSSFPDRGSWDEWLSGKAHAPVSQKIQQVLEMESMGCSVELCQVDVSKESQVKDFLQGIMTKYSKVDGLIWAAGEVDYGGIIEKREAGDFIKYLSSKVHGLLLFEKYLDFKGLDFVALFSSIGNVFYQGKFGQVGYNASNEFLESYAYYLQKKLGIHAFSINWCDWLDVGMTVNTIKGRLQSDDIRLINSEIADGISPQEGIDIFHKCLQGKVAVTTVYKGDLLAKIESYRSGFNEIRQTLTAPGESVQGVVPNDIEGELVRIFSAFFGRDDISMDDDFFELGGDSLKGMTLVARINQKIGSALTIGDLYRCSTLRQITEELLDYRTDAAGRHIPKAGEKQHYVLSSAQKRMYFLQMLDKESTAYNEVQTLWIEGDLDKGKLETTFEKLVNRHESLRTSFIYEDDLPMQVVSATVALSIEYYKYDEAQLDQTIRSFIRPHNFLHAPLFRVGVMEKNAKENLLIIDMHHIITDLVSSNILRRDLVKLYNEELPALKLQYKDYAEWQQSEEQQRKIAKQKQFWINEFSEIPEVLSLPADFPRPSLKSNVGSVLHFEIGPEETTKLTAMASDEEVSMFMVLLSIYTILLSKLSGQEDIVVGTPTAGRQHADLENIVGMFINTIALRNHPKGSLRYKDYLRTVRTKTINSFDNQNYPYEELIEALDIERDVSRSPLFDVMFNFKSINNIDEALPLGLKFKIFEFEQNRSKFDITLWALQSADSLQLSLEYSTALFKHSTIKRFETYFKELVKLFISNSTIQLKDVSLLTESDRKLQLRDFNATEIAFKEGETILDLFKEQVSKVSSDTAVTDGLQQLSYGDLDELSDKIAFHLRDELGIEAGTLVGLLLNRELLLIPVILGVLKAGCTYVPIDSVYPSERIEMIINQSGLHYLITRASIIATKSKPSCEVLDLTKIIDVIQGYPKRAFKIRVRPEDFAYVIYTSGSTGSPKGLIIGHASLHNYISWAKGYYTGNERLSFALFTSISFDLTVTSIFTPLVTGGKILMYEMESEGVLVEEVFRQNKSDIIKLTPSHLQIINESGILKDLSHLQVKKLIVGGELLENSLARSIYDQSAGKISIHNEYGPTEATVGCMIYEYNREDEFVSVPIGVPISNTQIYLLDRYLQPVAEGVQGQIYIAGRCLSPGYLSQVELTSEKFVRNIFNVNELMYATGDSGVRRSSGIIEYQGRVDDQVKIRGFRIELGEIQYHLGNHPQVRDSSVLVKGEGSNRYLVGYYVSASPLQPSELRVYLLNWLPEYMVPNHYIHLTAFPLDSNGKLLRSKLPEVELYGENESINSLSEIEEKLLEIWAHVLKMDKQRLDVDDNFFELGGHSLKAAILINRINKSLGTTLRLNSIFEKPTIRLQAEGIKVTEWLNEGKDFNNSEKKEITF